MASLPYQDDTNSYGIYTGVWTNWAHGKTFGATLTTTRARGSLLIAFVSLFVTVVGTSFWRIGCFVLHRAFSTEASRDGLHHQRQAILRNAATGMTGFWSLCQVLHAWSRTAERPYRRLLPTISFTAATVLAFAVASTFSSRVSTSTGSEVLLSGDGCGKADLEALNDTMKLSLWYPYTFSTLAASSSYAQQCYARSINDPVSCAKYVRSVIPTHIDRRAACPFDPSMCKSQDANIRLDTGFIDSQDLGVNARRGRRFRYRRVLHCAPLVTDGYSASTRVSAAGSSGHRNVTQYFYGQRGRANYTYMYPTTPFWKSFMSTSQDITISLAWATSNKSVFQPIAELDREGADVGIVFLSTNQEIFIGHSEDPWYATNTSITPEPGLELSRSEEPASPLGCTMQHQLCNPALAHGDASSDDSCTPLFASANSSARAQHTARLWPDADDRAAAAWSFELALREETTVPMVLYQLGATALESSSRRGAAMGMQGQIAPNQWQMDVEKWHNISMAAVQQTYVELATGPTDPGLRRLLSPPSSDGQRELCANQMVRSTAYTNFSVFGLAVVFAVGALVILLAWTVEPLDRWIQARRNWSVYARLEWAVNETLQLQRLAHEELGLGSWKDCSKGVPVAGGRDRLGVVDLRNAAHLKLKPPPPSSSEEALLSSPEQGFPLAYVPGDEPRKDVSKSSTATLA